MISTRDIDEIIGSDALDQDNDKIGKVGQVYLDSESDQPVWVSVKSGLFGTSETLVPLSGADWDHSALHLAFSKDRVKDAPRVEPDAELSPEEQDRLYDYYGLSDGADQAAGAGAGGALGGVTDRNDDRDGLQQRDRTTIEGRADTDRAGTDRADADRTDTADAEYASGGTGLLDDENRGARTDVDRDSDLRGAGDMRDADLDAGAGARDAGAFQGADTATTRSAGRDTSGANTDDAMTRSEERLNVGTERVQTGKARLRKYVVTEQQSVTVPVSREEVRIEREPITDANRGDALDGADLSEEEHEVVLTEERPVVEKETVPVERVRLGTEEVTEQRQVTEDVRHEEITTDGDDVDGIDRTR